MRRIFLVGHMKMRRIFPGVSRDSSHLPASRGTVPPVRPGVKQGPGHCFLDFPAHVGVASQPASHMLSAVCMQLYRNFCMHIYSLPPLTPASSRLLSCFPPLNALSVTPADSWLVCTADTNWRPIQSTVLLIGHPAAPRVGWLVKPRSRLNWSKYIHPPRHPRAVWTDPCVYIAFWLGGWDEDGYFGCWV